MIRVFNDLPKSYARQQWMFEVSYSILTRRETEGKKTGPLMSQSSLRYTQGVGLDASIFILLTKMSDISKISIVCY